jgi:predicted metal-dependent phosphoesterase TrpH
LPGCHCIAFFLRGCYYFCITAKKEPVVLKAYCDLHVHSNCSDGTLTPSELIFEAEKIGLGAIALTDHNTIDGLPEFITAAAQTSVQAVPGIEFSAEYKETELHILALFIQPHHYDAIKARADAYLREKELSNLALARALNDAGYSIDYEAVKARTAGIPNRANFAAELISKGYLSSVREGCLTILSPKNGLYTPPPRPDAFETISFIRSIGAVSVLAHPFLNLKEPDLRIFLELAKPFGLDAMETRYSTFDATLTEKAIAIARDFSVKESGGSDFHGSNKPDISLGTGKGNLAIPMALLRQLRQ